jgi:hypothetical protein
MKIRRMGAELFHAVGQTDITKLMVPLRNFPKMSKNKKRSKMNGLTL